MAPPTAPGAVTDLNATEIPMAPAGAYANNPIRAPIRAGIRSGIAADGERTPARFHDAVVVRRPGRLAPAPERESESPRAPAAERPAFSIPAPGYTAPGTGLEQRISGIWQEALQLERVGLHDNFFDLGGHSLLLIQVRNRLQDLLAREISTTTLLQYPTVGSLAAHLSHQNGEGTIKTSQSRAETRKALTQRQQDRRQKLTAQTGGIDRR